MLLELRLLEPVIVNTDTALVSWTRVNRNLVQPERSKKWYHVNLIIEQYIKNSGPLRHPSVTLQWMWVCDAFTNLDFQLRAKQKIIA